MSLEQRIEKLANGIQALNDLIEKYPGPGFTDGIYTDSVPLKPDALRRAAMDMAQEGRNLRVGIIGRVKAGKSSLLNALMFDGKDILPKAATPMTASLTVLRYSESDKPHAEVEYFAEQDVKDMQQLAQEYDQRFDVLVAAKVKEAEEKAARPGVRSMPQPDPERIKNSVRRELDADPRLGGAKDMYERIRVAGGFPGSTAQRIEGNDLADLQKKLNDYVGADGRFTPFTKCLTLYLPLPALNGVDVVDTPGVNDPIRSREERTMQELHKCDVVFVVSPAGQFLNQQDLELMGRLAFKEGVREVFLVASQIDGQLFGSERDKHNGQLTGVLQGLRQTLAVQAGSALGAVQSGMQGLDTLKAELAQRLVITSSVAYALYNQPESQWDETTRHAWSLLSSSYPNEFAQISSAKPSLETMAGIVQTEQLLTDVRKRKQTITEEKMTAFLDDQAKALRGYFDIAPVAVQRNRDELVSAKSSDLEEKLNAMQSVRERAIRATNNVVGDIADEASLQLKNLISQETDLLFNSLEHTAEKSKDTEVEHYTADKSGLLSWGARLLGLGGTEQRSRNVDLIDATAIRNALQKFHSHFTNKIESAVDSTRQGLRRKFEAGILATLREHKVVNDRDLDSTRLSQACRAALAQVREFDEVVLPELPSSLMQNGTLKGNQAHSFESDAFDYLSQLRKASNSEARKLTKDFESRLQEVDIGALLFSHYEEHLAVLIQQIQERDKTLQRYDELLVAIKGLQQYV